MNESDDEKLLEAAMRVADGESLAEGETDSNPLRNLATLASLGGLFRQKREQLQPEIPERWGSLVILESIGQGGFGEVYRARDTALERDVALKLRSEGNPAADSEFLREARRLARVRHPNVLAIHGAESTQGLVGLWCELIDGPTLEAQIAAGKVFSEAEVLDIARQLGAALAAVHEAGLVHGDVKAANAMVDRGDRVVLMDFGAAHAGERPRYGSPVSMAPECLAGGIGTPASDAYALGVLLYRLATGRFPHAQTEREELLAAKRSSPGDPGPLGALSRPARTLILQLLAADPAQRPSLDALAQRVAGLADRRGRLIQRVSLAAVAAVAVVALTARFMGADPEPIPDPAAIAVLPFENLSGDPAQQYFADGLSATLIQRLASAAELRVVSRSSSFALARQSLSPKAIGERLQVNSLLTGTVQRSPDRLRIFAELVEVGTGAQLWSATFERPAQALFAVQDEIAARVVMELRGALWAPRDEDNRETDLDTYESYLQGIDLLAQRGAEAIPRSIELLEAVVERDPEFASGWSALASAYLVLPSYARPSPGNFQRIEEAARRAIELDPLDGQALAVLGSHARLREQWAEAERLLLRAIDAEPSNADARLWYGEMLASVGRWRESRDETAVSAELNPLGSAQRGNYGWALIMTGNPAAGLRQCEVAWEMGVKAVYLWQCRFEAFLALEDYASARAWIEEIPVPAGPLYAAYVDALETHEPERVSRAAEMLEQSVAARRLPAFAGTYMLSMLGEVDRAHAIVAEALDAGRFGMIRSLFSPQNAALQADPRFEELVGRLGLPAYWRSSQLPDMCRDDDGTLRCGFWPI